MEDDFLLRQIKLAGEGIAMLFKKKMRVWNFQKYKEKMDPIFLVWI